MPATLTIPILSRRRKNRRKESPLKRIVIFLAILIGIAVAIAAHQQKEPARHIAAV